MLKKVIAIAVIICVLAAIAGYGYVTFFPGGRLAVPELKEAHHEWGVVNETVTEIKSTFIIYNPGGYSARIEDLVYDIFVNDIKMATGRLAKPVELKPRRNSTVRVSTFIDNTKIPDLWVSYITNNETLHVEVKGEALVKAFGLTFHVPIRFTRDYRPEPPLEERLDVNEPHNVTIFPNGTYITVERVDTSWGEVSQETTVLIHNITIYNPNNIPIALTEMNYTAVVNGLSIAEGEQPVNVILGRKERRWLLVYTYIDNTLIDDWWVSHVRNGERSTVEITIYLITRSGAQVPIYERTFTIETDLLGAASYP